MDFKQAIKPVRKKNVHGANMAHKYVRQAEQDDYIAWWIASGLSVEDFCRGYSISPASLSRWLKCKDKNTEASGSSTVKSRLTQEEQAYVPTGVKSIELSLPGGGALSLQGDLDHQLVISLLREVL